MTTQYAHLVSLLPPIAVGAIGTIACGVDLATRRIPNWLTFSGALLGLAYHAVVGGASGSVFSLAGVAAGLVLFFPWFALGGMGAGDVKLLAALGAWLGPWGIVWAALYGTLIGGLMGVFVAAWNRYLLTAVQNVGLILMFWRTSGIQPVPNLTLATGAGPKMAYSLPIVAGAACSLWWR